MRFRQVVFILVIFGAFLYLRKGATAKGYHVYDFSGLTMGTTYSVHLASEEQLDVRKIKEEVDQLLVEVNRQMSTYIPDSEISQFNKLENKDQFKISKEFFEVVEIANDIYQKTEGIFDPTMAPLVNLWGFGPEKRKELIPTDAEIVAVLNTTGMKRLNFSEGKIAKTNHSLQLDLSAIAKGYGVDLVSRLVNKYSENHLVEIGGEVYVKGFKDPKSQKKWTVGVEKPNYFNKSVLYKQIELKDQCIATSGDYRNFFKVKDKKFTHILDPRSGKPAQTNVVGVSVIATTCARADALATAFFIGGNELAQKIKKLYPNVSGFILKASKDSEYLQEEVF